VHGLDKINLRALHLDPSQFDSLVMAALSSPDGISTQLDLGLLGGSGHILVTGMGQDLFDRADFIL